jgi:hypothetical protein
MKKIFGILVIAILLALPVNALAYEPVQKQVQFDTAGDKSIYEDSATVAAGVPMYTKSVNVLGRGQLSYVIHYTATAVMTMHIQTFDPIAKDWIKVGSVAFLADTLPIINDAGYSDRIAGLPTYPMIRVYFTSAAEATIDGFYITFN